MSTPPPPQGPDDGTSPGPANPYGAPPPQPYGQAPYGQPVYGGGPYAQEPKTDAVSITAFVLSLTFCLSVVGLILGFVGLSRTKGGKRKGRWAAIAAIPIGLVLTGISAVLVAVVGIFAASVVTIDEAKAGLCVDVDDSDNEVILTEAECSEAHDAEIVYAGEAGQDAATLETGAATSICLERLPAAYQQLQGEEYDLLVVLEDPNDVAAGDIMVCYVERQDGGDLDSKLG